MNAISKEQAISLAESALRKRQTRIGKKPSFAYRCNSELTRGQSFTGWRVVVSLDVPPEFSPDTITVEIYEPNGDVNVIPTL